MLASMYRLFGSVRITDKRGHHTKDRHHAMYIFQKYHPTSQSRNDCYLEAQSSSYSFCYRLFQEKKSRSFIHLRRQLMSDFDRHLAKYPLSQ